jgi:hypothetical protein
LDQISEELDDEFRPRVIAIIIHILGLGQQSMILPELTGEIFRMGVELHILPLPIQPTHYVLQLVKLVIGTAQIDEEDMLSTELIPDRTHLTDASSSSRISPPDQTLDMIRLGSLR